MGSPGVSRPHVAALWKDGNRPKQCVPEKRVEEPFPRVALGNTAFLVGAQRLASVLPPASCLSVKNARTRPIGAKDS